jgi:hypothetical protein
MTTTGISRPDTGTKVLTESTIIGYLGSPAFTEDPFPAYRFFLDHRGWPSPSGYRVFARMRPSSTTSAGPFSTRKSSTHDVRALFRLARGRKGVTRDGNCPGL